MAKLNYLYVEDDRLSREVMETLLRDMMSVTTYTIWENSDNFIHRLEGLTPTWRGPPCRGRLTLA